MFAKFSRVGKANYTLRNGTEQLQGHTMGNKYKIIIFVLDHCFGEYFGLLSITSLSS